MRGRDSVSSSVSGVDIVVGLPYVRTSLSSHYTRMAVSSVDDCVEKERLDCCMRSKCG